MNIISIETVLVSTCIQLWQVMTFNLVLRGFKGHPLAIWHMHGGEPWDERNHKAVIIIKFAVSGGICILHPRLRLLQPAKLLVRQLKGCCIEA